MRERERVCVFVCVRVSLESTSMSQDVCMCVRERVCVHVCECVYVCVRERVRERESA